ncbi:DUF3037 domain-containing protein [Actinoalloteichus hymeniacidonis]|uniref:DUF3037 family protein n=1 Tax=Actinoalloteichus hymeniacidonis TaxID=340345 RepID=A0AAC9HQ94_9PSEU|nr:DUF3037 domain-containing protein [Actinoalloteichus hymeniacidonis]AOS63445.1 putative DUF3037 family protein [Actinoalloteichus hymeniacidonis]MBB5908513.1 hypothetical protein [Actinoalloteichus hymeniacidonis]
MSELAVFEYATLRVVPRIERAESINVGVLLYCGWLDFLQATVALDAQRLTALDPRSDVDSVRAALRSIERVCSGEDRLVPACQTSRGQRFRWLTAPRSTVVQTGPVHAGLTDDPAAELERLTTTLVR